MTCAGHFKTEEVPECADFWRSHVLGGVTGVTHYEPSGALWRVRGRLRSLTLAWSWTLGSGGCAAAWGAPASPTSSRRNLNLDRNSCQTTYQPGGGKKTLSEENCHHAFYFIPDIKLEIILKHFSIVPQTPLGQMKLKYSLYRTCKAPPAHESSCW